MTSTNRWISLVLGIALVLFGIWSLTRPVAVILTLTIFISIGMIVYGISEIIMYFTKKDQHYSGWVLASGIITTLFGLWLTFIPGGQASLAIVLPFMFSFWVMISGVIRISAGVTAKKQGLHIWSWLLVLGIIGVVIGFIMMFSPLITALTLAYIVGIVFIWNGIMTASMFFLGNKQ